MKICRCTQPQTHFSTLCLSFNSPLKAAPAGRGCTWLTDRATGSFRVCYWIEALFFLCCVVCGVVYGTSMVPITVACVVFVLLGSKQSQVHSQSQGQDSSAPWRQVIQWENNGRTYSLLNSGAEYVPAGTEVRDRGPRVVVADANQRARRPQGGNVRRQAPVRASSETVRGNRRHPFGFGQVSENWRHSSSSTGGGQFQGSSSIPFRPSTGSSSSSSSSSSFSSYNIPSYPQYPIPQQPPFQPVPWDPGFVEEPARSYEPPFQTFGYGGGTYGTLGGYGGGVGGAGGAGGGVGVGGGVPPNDFSDDGYQYYQPHGYGPNPVVPARAAQPPFTDGLDHRYTQSLYNDNSSPVVPGLSSNPAAPVMVDRTGPVARTPVRSPQYEQFPPFGRPQPPFLQPVSPGRSSPNSALENPSVSVGSVYRREQRGMSYLPFIWSIVVRILKSAVETCEKLWRHIATIMKFASLVETGSVHLQRNSRRLSSSKQSGAIPMWFVLLLMRECKICKVQGIEEPIHSPTLFLPVSQTPQQTSRGSCLNPTSSSVYKQESSYSLHYTIIFPNVSHCCYWKQILSELCQCTEEEHKNLCWFFFYLWELSGDTGVW